MWGTNDYEVRPNARSLSLSTNPSVVIERDINAPANNGLLLGRQEEAERGLYRLFSSGRDMDEVLDKILDTPRGFCTGRPINKFIVSFPLGAMCALLRRRCVNRFGNLTEFNNLMYEGGVWRMKNTVEVLPPIPSHYLHHPEGTTYTPKRIYREIASYDFLALPLHRVEPTIPYTKNWFDENDVGGLYLSEYVNVYTSPTTLVEQDEPMMTLEEYVNRITSKIGGSDVSFWIMTVQGHFSKRYEPTPVFWLRNKPVFRSRSLRSAGLRQVLLEDKEIDIEFKQFERYKIFIPGGLRNCFLASVRWSFVKQNYDRYLSSITSELECAQDEDMLCSSLPTSFNEEEEYLRIDQIISEVLKLRLEKHENQTLQNYQKLYRNGFPTIELKGIAQEFLNRYGIWIIYYRIDRHGRWENQLDLQFPSSSSSSSGS